MDFCKMAVFLYCGIILHCFADFLSHRWKNGYLILLHCFLYTLFFIPLFLWFGVGLWWLAVIFASHLAIDRPLRIFILWLVNFFSDEQNETIVFGLDQIFHAAALLAVALIVF